jgi:hypothetical protein
LETVYSKGVVMGMPTIANRVIGWDVVGQTAQIRYLPTGTNELGGMYTVLDTLTWVVTDVSGTLTLYTDNTGQSIGTGRLLYFTASAPGTYHYVFPNGFPVVLSALTGLSTTDSWAVLRGDGAGTTNTVFCTYHYRRSNG